MSKDENSLLDLLSQSNEEEDNSLLDEDSLIKIAHYVEQLLNAKGQMTTKMASFNEQTNQKVLQDGVAFGKAIGEGCVAAIEERAKIAGMKIAKQMIPATAGKPIDGSDNVLMKLIKGINKLHSYPADQITEGVNQTDGLRNEQGNSVLETFKGIGE